MPVCGCGYKTTTASYGKVFAGSENLKIHKRTHTCNYLLKFILVYYIDNIVIIIYMGLN